MCEILEAIKSHEAKLKEYAELLLDYNRYVRLVGPSDAETLWEEHILDCAAALPLLPPSGRVVDVGSGGGLPGMVWAICKPDITVSLVEATRRKCEAVERMIKGLKLENARVIWARAEEEASLRREFYDVAAARAVAEAGVLVEYLSPLVKVGGTLLAFKGRHARSELDPLTGRWLELGLGEPKLERYEIRGKERYVVLWEKVGLCPDKYPRRPGMAEKRPWWR
ncbi:MAG: Ribosomal RNA small subunit methyltransferase G [Synergistales bacterium 54_24]|nr:MAG: Ribosomal RNA small subunit methyltransferase G [Synergistales bacterium 54_24]HAF49782.1 16S rRNA (guanine(527)-N(7))-methyltransferase RsmG [Synergistaceae bacterium]